MKHQTELQIEAIHEMIANHSAPQKEHLNLSEAAKYLGLSKSFIYKKTSKRDGLPFYKIGNKLIYFKKSELDAWLVSNRQNTLEEIALNAELSFTQKRKNHAN